MKTRFIGRERELEVLDQAWQGRGAELVILYGRRRVGKTSLMAHWIRSRGNRALYWVVEPSSALAQLRAFSQAVYTFAFPGVPVPPNFTFATWEQAFQQVAGLTQPGRMALFIDEFTYLLETDPAVAGRLQNIWDGSLKNANLVLGLSGSHLGMMKREFLSYQAPLYGRASRQIFLQPLPYGCTNAYFPGYTAAERVAIYAIFGGVPAYWERLDPDRSLQYNIKSQLLTANNLMQAEPRLLLSDFINETHNYIAILTAIAGGARTPKEIAAFTGLPNMHIPKYLSVLAEAGFVERRIPVTDKEPSRAGRHQITDPYLRFYYRFLHARQEQLALGIQEPLLAEVNRQMGEFIGKHTWEELCREWTLRGGAKGELPFLPDRVGSYWDSKAQVDVVGINRTEKTLILGECKWTNTPVDRRPLAELVEQRAAAVVPKEGKWKVFFLGFSRSGWSSTAQEYAGTLTRMAFKGHNWTSAGMRLVDLDELDFDLSQWS